jgi:hypothetical protein
MKFFFADSHDFIDPGFDFDSEEYTEGRRAQHDDVYPHEYFERAPYDGMLISRAAAKHLHQNLGYDYIALGGMVPLKSSQIIALIKNECS